ncbi:hypothetical protein TPAR_05448 [Tolypocladium paradoxum]|uniref:FAD-binding domain-containing protein n=1 Tax=Tolypocladium paradoxum TaxID=94208 RepID=A0A2S4KW38_9HYPO|nr:hypothetical protein TPAR_05448 [Tolypocladium paradoxum]
MSSTKNFSVAIVGGGIAGLTLAIALHHRGIPVMVYERAARFGEIGAGVSFTPNAVRAMQCCHPGIHDAFERACTRNGWPSKQDVWFDFVDGTDSVTRFSIRSSLGQNGVHRAHFLDHLVKLLPSDKAVFGKCLEEISDNSEGKVVMKFRDGTVAYADVVVGCDGIKSRVRQHVVGPGHPSAFPSYTHKYAYRAMVPMEKAIQAIGEEKARNACMHMGHGGHVLTFPVDHGKRLNIVAFHTSSADWDDYERTTKIASREDAFRDFSSFGSDIGSLLKLVDPQLSVWAIFDLGDNPVPTFYKGRVCISGDAAHATSPHHGAGAGFCIEDSFVLAELLADPCVRGPQDLQPALAAFDQNRRQRSQWLVQSSRWIGDCYEWQAKGIEGDLDKIEAEINERNGIIANFDIQQASSEARRELQSSLTGSTPQPLL